MSSPTSSPPTSRTLRSLSSCHGGFEIPTCALSDTLARFGSLRSGWSLIALPFRVCLSCCFSIRTRRASRLPTHIRSRPSLEKPLKEIRNFQLDFYAEISKWPASLQEVDNTLDRDQPQIFVARLASTRGRYFDVEGGRPVHPLCPDRLDCAPILCDLGDCFCVVDIFADRPSNG